MLHTRNIDVSFYHLFSIISIPQPIVSLLPTSFFPVFSMANKSISSGMFRLHCSSHIDTGTYWSVAVMLKLVPHHKKGVGNYPQIAPHKGFFSCILPRRRAVNLLWSFTLLTVKQWQQIEYSGLRRNFRAASRQLYDNCKVLQRCFKNVLNKEDWEKKGNNGSVSSPSAQLSWAQAIVWVRQKQHTQVLPGTQEGWLLTSIKERQFIPAASWTASRHYTSEEFGWFLQPLHRAVFLLSTTRGLSTVQFSKTKVLTPKSYT